MYMWNIRCSYFLKSFNYEFKFICTMIQYEIFLLLTYLFRLCQVFIAGGLFSRCGRRERLSSYGVHTSRCSNFSCCRAQDLGAWAQQFWCMGLDALQRVESSWTRDQTPVPCIGRWILYHWTTREVLHVILFWQTCK